METKIIFIFIALLFGLYNGYFNLWGLELEPMQKKRHSDSWHAIGWIIRAAMASLAALLWGNLFGWVAVILLWHCFDLLINLLRGQKWNYSGTVSTFDKHSKLVWIGKIAWLLAGIYFLI